MIPRSRKSCKTIAEQYAWDVVKGKVVACKWVKLACERHWSDLDKAEKKGWVLDKEAGYRVIYFVEKFLHHTSGQWAGQPVELQPWQHFVVFSLFSWYTKRGGRRFTSSYIEIPKKNGKSFLASALSVYMLFGDGEANAEVYYAATKRDQAKITFEEAQRMVKANALLNNRLTITRDAIADHESNSSAKPLSSDKDGIDGKRPFFTVVDEYHQHKTSEISDELMSASASRLSPLHFTITTAGFNVNGPCYRLQKSCREILSKKRSDESLFTIIFTIDEGDDWQKVASWKKANPNYGVSFYEDSMHTNYKKARNLGGQKEVEFKTKRLNVWVKSSAVWIREEAYDACKSNFRFKDFYGKEVWLGMDLAANRDICAVTVLCEHEGKFRAYNKYWLPEDTYEEYLSEDEKHIYKQFVEEGWLILTPGNITDYDAVRRYITGYHTPDGHVEYDEKALCMHMTIKTLGFDQWNAYEFAPKLYEDGCEIVRVIQTTTHLNAPTRRLEELILSKQFEHNGDPVLRWMMGNVVLKRDSSGNVKPDKDKSSNKIDGVASLLNALHQYMTPDENQLPDNLEIKWV